MYVSGGISLVYIDTAVIGASGVSSLRAQAGAHTHSLGQPAVHVVWSTDGQMCRRRIAGGSERRDAADALGKCRIWPGSSAAG